MDLKKFIYKDTLEANPTQKTLYLLGTIQGHHNPNQQAIIIITPKFPSLRINTNNTLHQPKDQQTSQTKDNNQSILPFTHIQTIFQNDIYSKYEVRFQNSFEIQSIFPITEKHKAKYRKKLKFIQKQTYQKYEEKKQSLLKQELTHIGWVKNIIDGKAQQQRVLYEDDDIMLLPDFKFHNLKQVENLHLLCIFKDLSLHSIRDLNQTHLSILQKVQNTLKQQMQKHFTFNEQQLIGVQNCRVYFHYPPTFYQLHLHIQSLQLDTKTSNTQRCHMLSTVIENIKIKADYYQKVSLNCFKQQFVNNGK